MPLDKKGDKRELPPIVTKVPDPPVPNRAHTEMKRENEEDQKKTR